VCSSDLFGVLFLLIISLKIVRSIVIGRFRSLVKKTKTDLDDTFLEIFESIKPRFYSFIAFYIAISFLNLPDIVKNGLDFILVIWVVCQTIISFQILIDYAVLKTLKKEENRGTQDAISTISKIAKIFLWSAGILFILSNFGVNITSLIAGLGIGGIAIALALQNILSDLFSSFAIYFDKPFVVGDFIIVGDKMGVVEKIGIKTTRIRALQGEEIVLSNKELTSAQLQNFKKMRERRVVFSFGVVYDTPLAKLKKIPGIIRKIVKAIEMTRFDRAHFYNFGDFSLNFEVVYYVKDSDYNKYMDIHQEINFNIKEAFEKENISMAFPTQTVQLQGLANVSGSEIISVSGKDIEQTN